MCAGASDSCLGGPEYSCAEGYAGPKCSHCAQGYLLWHGTCSTPCTDIGATKFTQTLTTCLAGLTVIGIWLVAISKRILRFSVYGPLLCDAVPTYYWSVFL